MSEKPRKRTALPVLGSKPAADPAAGSVTPWTGTDARIGLITLGCDKNTVDSERILGRLHGAGANVADQTRDADVIVINTCGFIDRAKEESIDTILEAVRLKTAGKVRAVVAMGCLVQRYQSELQAELPEVDLFLGLSEVDRLVPELIARGLISPPPSFIPTMEMPLRVMSTATRHTSYLKISEGCDHGCAFCAIPLMRGKHRSTPIDLLVREAQELEKSGVHELNIISQDTTWYGRDLLRGSAAPPDTTDYFMGRPFATMAGPHAPPPTPASAPAPNGASRRGLLPELLRALLDNTSIPWLRLFYMYPSGIQKGLIDVMASEPRILPYLDMPIQHGSDRMLAAMRRPERQRTIRERVDWLRSAIPNLALRTTVIVGFPGETEDDFEDMLALLEEIRFDHLGAFAYSVEEGTPAGKMDEQVPEAIRRERLERLLDVQRSITLEKNERRIGSEMLVLIDEAATRGNPAIGRTYAQALEVDSTVRVRGAGLKPGMFVRARITGAGEDELMAEVVGGETARKRASTGAGASGVSV
jgi:ribosomal protein S12 methylthiotransferase